MARQRSGDATRTEDDPRGAAQPRPALGRRPWLALLRRARSLRRFALAMAGRIPARGRVDRIGPVVLRATEWTHRPVAVASTWRTRRAGLAPLPLGWGLLIAGRSVHGRGLCAPLAVVGIDPAGVVIGAVTLRPGSLVKVAGAAAILELPVSVAIPDPGAVLAWAPLPAQATPSPDS